MMRDNVDNDDKEGVDDDDNEDNNADVASNADNHLVPLTAGSEPLQAQSGSWQRRVPCPPRLRLRGLA